MKTFECTIELGTVYPVRQANDKQEFVRELVKEYNATCGYLFKINQTHIKDITESDNE
jgi:predicted small metal-binding protein